MRVVVIGGTGMVGPGVLRALTSNGDDVYAVHRGRQRATLPAGVHVVHCDRRDPERLGTVIARLSPDAVVDLACYTAGDAVTTVDTCGGVPRVLVVSSVNAGGGPVDPPLSEDAPSRPVSAYGRDKLAAEEVFRQEWRSGRSSALLVRLGAVYRPECYVDGQLGEDAYWLCHLTAGQPALVADDGEAHWNLLHADDAGRAIRALLCGPASATTVLLGSRRPMRWRRVYELAYARIGVPFRLWSRPAGWWQEQLGEPGFLHEMSMWDQVYRLDRLARLAPDYQEWVDHRQALGDTVSWLVAHNEIGDRDLADQLMRIAGHRHRTDRSAARDTHESTGRRSGQGGGVRTWARGCSA